MKIRIKGNSVRLRITKPEVDSIAKGEIILEKVEFPVNTFQYQIGSGLSSSISFRDGMIEVQVASSVLKNWSNSDQVGIDFVSDKISVLIEKDFACLITRDGEDDADAFPNPHATHAG